MAKEKPAESEDPFVLHSVSEGVLTITLNRPARLNAMGHGPGSMQRAIVDLLVAADTDDAIGCVVKPVIGAINGICYGAAFMMVAHFDMLVASSEARFGLIETRFGGTGAEALNYLLGPQWAKFMALTGELITAEKAKEIGLVLEVVPPEALMARTHDLARRIAAMPRDTMIMNRRLINTGMNASGWKAQKEAGLAFNAAANSCFTQHRAWNGERFSDLRKKGWDVYKEVRDAPFKKPWLEAKS